MERPSNHQIGNPGDKIWDENDSDPDCPRVVRWREKVYADETREQDLNNYLSDGETHPGEDCLWILKDGAIEKEDGVDQRHDAIDEERTAKE